MAVMIVYAIMMFLPCAGSTMWWFCYPFLLSSLCHLSRVSWDMRKIWE